MARFSRWSVRCYAVWYEIHRSGGDIEFGTCRARWSKQEAVALFMATIDPGEDVILFEVVQGQSIVDRRNCWFLDYYALWDHVDEMY